ncbi:MAG: hypothetical protein ABR498_07040 [Candidatus Dormibacteria bacterium]
MSRIRRLAFGAIGAVSLLATVHAQAAGPIAFALPTQLKGGAGG